MNMKLFNEEKVMNLVEKVRKLEEALCQANGKLFAIEDACKQEIHEWYDNTKHSMGNCPDYDILQGRVEFAEQISNLTE